MPQGGRRYFQKGADRADQGEQEPMADSGTITITNAQLQMLIEAAAKQASTAPAGLTADALAQAFKTANTRENPQAPMVSVFNPKGETAHPRPALRCKTFQNGIPMDHDTLAWEEIEALNALPPGEFRVNKANGVSIVFTVKLTKGLDGETLEKCEIGYPTKDEHRNDHRSLFDYCVDVLEFAGLTAESDRVRGVKREMDALRRQTVA